MPFFKMLGWYLINPRLAARRIAELAGLQDASFTKLLESDRLPYPPYAYGMWHASLQAKALGLARISAIEFGVAGGNGLVAMERLAGLIHDEIGITIDTHGFDTGKGMPAPVDYRDNPYIWKDGYFSMDEGKLRKRLKSSTLVLGDVQDTLKSFLTTRHLAPIGFVAFDLDYYSSTVHALRLFEAEHELLLPRVFSYFDDCVGDDSELHSRFTGELLAIDEFNQEHSSLKIAKIYGLPYKRRVRADWHEKTFVLHSFEHPLYSIHINPRKDWQMPLR